MAARDDFFELASVKLFEAMFDSVLDEINFLRTSSGLPTRTKDYFLGRAHNNLNHLDPYDWEDT